MSIDSRADLLGLRLPGIQRKVQELLRATEGELNELPNEPSKDPVGEVYNVISKFSDALAQYVEGTPGKGGLLQAIRPAQQSFRETICRSSPDFRPYSKPDADEVTKRRNGLTKPDFLSNEEEVHLPSDDDNAIYIDEVMDRARQYASARRLR